MYLPIVGLFLLLGLLWLLLNEVFLDVYGEGFVQVDKTGADTGPGNVGQTAFVVFVGLLFPEGFEIGLVLVDVLLFFDLF